MKEQQPLGIVELQQKLGKIDQALSKANKVSQTIGTPEFGRPELDISLTTRLSRTQYRDAAIRVGRVRKALAENAMPTLTTLKSDVEIQINDLKNKEEQAQKLEEIQRLRKLGYLPDYVIDVMNNRGETSQTQAITSIAEQAKGKPEGQATQKRPVNKSPMMLEVERIIKRDLEEFLREKYLGEGLGMPEIAKLIQDALSGDEHFSYTIGNIQSRINNWLFAFGIKTRSQKEAARLIWGNPDKRNYILSKIHSVEANEKRIDSIRRHSGLPKAGRDERILLVEQARKEGLIVGLSEREQLVINARYPAEGRPKTFSEIRNSQDSTITREGLRQIEKRVLRKLNALLKDQI